MAVHKVPQDVEAEDKLIGFLSMKQFIFVVIAVLLTFAAFQLATAVHLVVIIPFVPFIAIFAILGLYQRKDQPAETFLLAAMGFYLKPHKRIWSQDGVLETVNITVPKTIEHHYTDGLSKVEVKSRLDRLSTLMDTRGWAAKNAEYQTNVVAPTTTPATSDRLITPAPTTRSLPADIHPSDDMMDINNNATAQNFDKIMEKVAERTRKEALAGMAQTSNTQTAGGDNTNASKSTSPVKAPVYNPAPVGMHQKILSPVHDQSYAQNDDLPQTEKVSSTTQNSSASTMTPSTSDAILGLANERGDNLSIETIAKEADRLESLDSDETVSIH